VINLILISNLLVRLCFSNGFQVTEIRLKKSTVHAPVYLRLESIEPDSVVTSPTRALSHLTNAALCEYRVAQEARWMIFNYLKKPARIDDTLILLKGNIASVVMRSPDRLIAITKRDKLLSAVKMSLQLFGTWTLMNGAERSRLKDLL
jgi:hypothetical protein